MPLLNAGYVHSEEEYDIMVVGTKEEWLSCDAEFALYTRNPCNKSTSRIYVQINMNL